MLAHLLELEIPRVRGRSELPALQNDKEHSAHHGDQVQRQIQEVPDDCLRGESLKRLLGDLAQTRHVVASALHLALLGDERLLVAREQRAVESVNESIVDEEVLGEDVENGGSFGEDEQDSGDDGEGSVEDGEDGGLRDIGHCEHEDRNAETERDCRDELVGEGAPEGAVGEEEGDTLVFKLVGCCDMFGRFLGMKECTRVCISQVETFALPLPCLTYFEGIKVRGRTRCIHSQHLRLLDLLLHDFLEFLRHFRTSSQ